MATGIGAGIRPSQLHRLERAYSFRELHHELRVAVEELIKQADEDLAAICTVHEVETNIEILLNDQYGLSELLESRASEYRDFFEQYLDRVKCYDHRQEISHAVIVRCMQVAYKQLLCKLEV